MSYPLVIRLMIAMTLSPVLLSRFVIIQAFPLVRAARIS